MKCLICNPPVGKTGYVKEGRCTQKAGTWSTIWPPVTLVTVGTLLKEAGHDVIVFDGAVPKNSEKKLLKLTKKWSPELIVISTSTPTIVNDLKIVTTIKSLITTQILLFGIHASYFSKEIMTDVQDIDFIAHEELEQVVTDLAQYLSSGSPDIDSIKNLTFRKSNKIIENQSKFMQILDNLPFPDWGLVKIADYRLPLLGRCFLIIAPARGCPYKCVFCNASFNYGKKVRTMQPERIIKEIQNNMEKFKVRDFLFWADTFTFNKTELIDLCHIIINENLNIKWSCNSRIDTIDRELLSFMKNAGCWLISYGIESVDKKVLEMSKKGISLEQINETLRLHKEVGVLCAGHFILGLPGDTKHTIEKTIDWAASSPLNFAQFYSAVPFPGSELYEIAKNNNWLNSGIDFTSYNQQNVILELPDIKKTEVEKYMKIAFKKFINFRRIIRYISLLRLRHIGYTLINFIKYWRMNG